MQRLLICFEQFAEWRVKLRFFRLSIVFQPIVVRSLEVLIFDSAIIFMTEHLQNGNDQSLVGLFRKIEFDDLEDWMQLIAITFGEEAVN
jgi:hypothetical protein